MTLLIQHTVAIADTGRYVNGSKIPLSNSWLPCTISQLLLNFSEFYNRRIQTTLVDNMWEFSRIRQSFPQLTCYRDFTFLV